MMVACRACLCSLSVAWTLYVCVCVCVCECVCVYGNEKKTLVFWPFSRISKNTNGNLIDL